MKRILRLTALLVLALGTAVPNSGTRHETALALSDAAKDYYVGSYALQTLSTLEGSTSDSPVEVWQSPLCAALHALMTDTRTELPTFQQTRSLFPLTDASGGSSEPLLFYSDGVGAYQREQVWANAKGNFYHEGAGCDLHHLRPADAQVDVARSSMTFGNVRTQSQSWQVVQYNGTPVLWVDPDWAGGTGMVEVRDEVKGDVARILLYVWSVYGGADGENQNLWVDQPPSGVGYEINEGQRVIASKEVLLEWCRCDPVDTWEMGRNDTVQALQGNRNVFIDYPELCWCLFDREIPDMPTPSGWAHGLYCTVSAVADPPEGGTVTVANRTVIAVANQGYQITGWSLEPEDGAVVTQNQTRFTLSELRQDCELTVHFGLIDPCALGHDWDIGVVVEEPTQHCPGTLLYTCTRCGITRTEEIPFRFDDVQNEAAYYYAPVYWALHSDPPCTAGTDARHFSPNRRCTRAQAVCFLWNAAGQPEFLPGAGCPFLDVPDSAWYRQAVVWATQAGVVCGTSQTTFSPSEPCTRAEFLTMLWRVSGSDAPEVETDGPFLDLPASAYYRRAVLWAAERGIVKGTAEGIFSPHAACTRAQAITILYRAAVFLRPQ